MMNDLQQEKKAAYLVLPIISGVCWGTSGLFVRYLRDVGFDNMTIIFSKGLVASAMMFLVIIVKNPNALKANPRDVPLLAAVGITGMLLLSVTYNEAVFRISLSLSSVLLCLAPVFVLIFGLLLFGEKLTRVKLACMCLAFLGCIMLSGIFDTGGNLQWDTIGFLFGLGSAVVNAAYTLVSKAATDRNYSTVTIYLYGFLAITVILAPFADWGLMLEYLLASPVKATFVYLGHSVWTSMLPGILYITAVKNADTGKTAILAAGAEPVSAMAAGLLVYHEVPSWIGFTGMIITIAALIILIRSDQKSPA